jgi:molybdopterin synthase catalytic subunit
VPSRPVEARPAGAYHGPVLEVPSADDWVAITGETLPLGEALEFVRRPSCGAVTLFVGTVRDHAPGRPGVTLVESEAWPEQVLLRMGEIIASARARWQGLGAVAILHRSGPLEVGEASVVVAVSSPHRADSLDAARWCIDTLKDTVPIWKHEVWDGGEDWGVDPHPISDVGTRSP